MTTLASLLEWYWHGNVIMIFEDPYLHSVNTLFIEYNLILFEVQSVFISLSPTDNIGSAPAPPFAITWAHKTTITTLALPQCIVFSCLMKFTFQYYITYRKVFYTIACIPFDQSKIDVALI